MKVGNNYVGKLKSVLIIMGFPDSSVGEESACNAGDPALIPGSGWSPGEGIGYPLWYSWASRVAQLVKNLPAIQETWVRSLGWEDPLEKGKATHSSILAWRIPGTIYSPWGRKELDKTECLSSDFHFASTSCNKAVLAIKLPKRERPNWLLNLQLGATLQAWQDAVHKGGGGSRGSGLSEPASCHLLL